jgi:hypothetical protein
MTMPHYIDIAHHSLNKFGEELCGDKVEIIKHDDRIIVVLADGLGSGVKANILATLTSKIMSTMLENGADLIETIDTITQTLPVCSVRKIGYSTFSIIELDASLHARIIEFDNPPFFLLRNHHILPIEKEMIVSSDKKVYISSVDLKIGDELTICSDGVIHAGVGMLLNFGWEWKNVAEFLEKQDCISSEKLNRRLIDACNSLYEDHPGDDTTAVTIKVRAPLEVQIFTGPPSDPSLDAQAIKAFMASPGKKVVCGGTAANIFARELGRDIITETDYINPEVPPTAEIEGLDLVTEGVLTLKMASEKLKAIAHLNEEPSFEKKDGVNALLKLLVEDSTHIHFWVGRALNPAHQNPDFPKELSLKTHIIRDMAGTLGKLGKIVDIHFTD